MPYDLQSGKSLHIYYYSTWELFSSIFFRCQSIRVTLKGISECSDGYQYKADANAENKLWKFEIKMNHFIYSRRSVGLELDVLSIKLKYCYALASSFGFLYRLSQIHEFCEVYFEFWLTHKYYSMSLKKKCIHCFLSFHHKMCKNDHIVVLSYRLKKTNAVINS